MHFLFLTSIAVLSTVSSAQLPSPPDLIPAASYTGCPPEGPLLPRPTDLANSKHIQNAAKNISKGLENALKGEIDAGWIVENVSFSLALVSPYGVSGVENNSRPFWEYHHRGKNNKQGVVEADGDTQYLIGSVSKVFSDLMVLKSGVDLQASVTDFLPQLRSNRSRIRWEDITLEMLADHLAGVPSNCEIYIRLLKLGCPANSIQLFTSSTFSTLTTRALDCRI